MYRNSEGYPDPTAGQAIANIMREQRRAARAKRRKADEAKATRLREWVMSNLGTEKLETPRLKLSVSKPRQVAVIDDPAAIVRWLNGRYSEGMDATAQEEYQHIASLLHIRYPDAEIDKAGIKKLIAEGYEIDGAHTEAGKPSLQIK